jgi:hypothetical protein
MSWSVCPLWGKQPWEHSVYQPRGRFMRPCISSSGCRAHSALHGGWDTDSLICLLGSQTNKSPLWDKYPTAVGQRGDDSSICFRLTMGSRGVSGVVLVSGADLCTLQRPPGNWTEGLCVGRSEYSLTKSWNLIHWTCWDMNLKRAFIIQGPNRNIRRSIKKGPARGSV